MKEIIKKINRIIITLYLRFKYKNADIKSYNVSKDIILKKKVAIGKKVYISNNVKIDKYSYCNSNFNWSIIESNVSIGKFCSIGPGVSIGLGNHNYNYLSTHPFLYNKKYGFISSNKPHSTSQDDEHKETIIGNDVWIGANSNIKRGVKIGNGVVIAMNSVVTHDIPDYSIVAGIPAKIIKYRFSEEIIKKILEDPWWEKNETELKANLNKMYDINEYLK